MKILQVNCVYKRGSTGKIVYDIHSKLKELGFESVICYGRGKRIKEQNVHKTCSEIYGKGKNFVSRFTGSLYDGCFVATSRLISRIKKEKPGVVHLHCINGYFVNIYRLFEFLKKKKIKTVLTLHAEFMYTGGCGHAYECIKYMNGCGDCPEIKSQIGSYFFDRTAYMWQRMKKAFDGFDDNLIVTSVSPWLEERAKGSEILKDKTHTTVLNGLDTDVFYLQNSEDLKAKHGITNEKIIFHATPKFDDTPDSLKGGVYLIELAKKLPDVKFIVAGSYASDLNVPENMILLGRVTDQKELAKYYSIADATVLTSKRETFSMVTAESLCCGTAVAGFMAGGPEKIAIDKYSSFVPYGDVQALSCAVYEIFSKDFDKKEISNAAKKIYDKKIMTDGYIKVYQSFE